MANKGPLGECDGCHTLHHKTDLVFQSEGKVFHRAERMATGPAGWRWRTGEVYHVGREQGKRLCFDCRGVPRPETPLPLWRQAAAAWATADPSVRAMAPRARRA